MNWLMKLNSSHRLLPWLGVIVFAYSWFAGLLLQLWVIPTLFPGPGAVEGLVVIDSTGFNEIAKAKAGEISRLGWSAWELRPQWQSPAGIASVFYAVFGPVPTSMLPFNAVVHAASACVVMMILQHFYSSAPAFIGALVFALNPASFEWVAQIHRDGVFILGNLLLFMGVIGSVGKDNTTGSKSLMRESSMLTISIVGTVLIWVARPYWVQVALVTVVLAGSCLICVRLLKRFSLHKSSATGPVLLFLGLCFFQLWLIRFYTPYEPIEIPVQANPSAGTPLDQKYENVHPLIWKRSGWLPEVIEGRLYRIANVRWAALTQGGGTLVYANRPLDSAAAIFSHIPRAFQLGLLSPLPEFWGGQGSTPAMTMARKVMGGVTLVFYFCLLGLAVGLYRMRKNARLWMMVGMCCLGILVYAVSYPNIGTLMRYRFGFYMLLIGFGVASWCDLWLRHDRNSRRYNDQAA